MEKKMATTIAYGGYIGIMEKKNGHCYLGFRVYRVYNPYVIPINPTLSIFFSILPI